MKKIVVKAMWLVVAVLLTGAYVLNIKDIAGKLTINGMEANRIVNN